MGCNEVQDENLSTVKSDQLHTRNIIDNIPTRIHDGANIMLRVAYT